MTILMTIVGGLVLLGILANLFGVDTRTAFEDPRRAPGPSI
jgi:hypothetical protein